MEKFLLQYLGKHFKMVYYAMDNQFYAHVLTAAREAVLPPVVSRPLVRFTRGPRHRGSLAGRSRRGITSSS